MAIPFLFEPGLRGKIHSVLQCLVMTTYTQQRVEISNQMKIDDLNDSFIQVHDGKDCDVG
jgi:hypothetical protein